MLDGQLLVNCFHFVKTNMKMKSADSAKLTQQSSVHTNHFFKIKERQEDKSTKVIKLIVHFKLYIYILIY